MKKIIYALILFLIPSIILANEIYNIDMDIYIDNDGIAHVTETWKVNLTSGTEGYKPYYNLGSSSISNFKVKLNDKEYTFKDNYDVNASFDEKKYINGFNYISNGIELCFGISSYGKNTYTLSYDISNFVVNTSDNYQMIYWTLFPKNYNPSPGRVYIKIYSDFKYSDTLDVWGYGKGGVPTYVYDGYIEMDSETKVNSSEYMTILVKYPKDTFNLNTALDNTFDYYLDMANSGTTSDDNIYNNSYTTYIPNNNNVTHIFSFSIGLSSFLVFILVLIIVLANKSGYGYKNNKRINRKNVPLFRDIPSKDIYYVNTLVNLNKNIFSSCKETNIFGAIILKWVKEGKIKFITDNKNESSIDLTLNPTFDNDIEQKLFMIMKKASKDGILESRELEKWCKNNYTTFFNLFERINKKEIDKLFDIDYIYKRKNKKECKKRYVMSDTMYEDTIKLYGLKKFLEEFSRIGTREVLEVHIWDYYLMYAYIFGIADKVVNQLKNLYPEVIQDMNNIDYDTLIFINRISNRSISSASSARKSARAKAQSYSSGGGGFSSSGGGSGSFGGGGGGGGGFR